MRRTSSSGRTGVEHVLTLSAEHCPSRAGAGRALRRGVQGLVAAPSRSSRRSSRWWHLGRLLAGPHDVAIAETSAIKRTARRGESTGVGSFGSNGNQHRPLAARVSHAAGRRASARLGGGKSSYGHGRDSVSTRAAKRLAVLPRPLSREVPHENLDELHLAHMHAVAVMSELSADSSFPGALAPSTNCRSRYVEQCAYTNQ